MVLIIAGSGGHLEQARRLKVLIDSNINAKVILLTEDGQSNDANFDKVFSIPELRNKHSWIKTFFGLPNFFKNTLRTLMLIDSENVRLVISTGPGIAILPMIYYRLRSIPTVYIETWSKFSSLSLTGRILKYVVKLFIVQNKGLCGTFRKAVYGGRL